MGGGFVVRAVLFAAVYLACAGAGSVPEFAVAVGAGLATAALATALGQAARSYEERPFAFARRVPTVVAGIVRDAARLTLAFIRLALGGAATAGGVVERPFDVGAGTPEARSRRAFVIAAVGTAPNTVPLTIDYAEARLRVHTLLPTPEAKDTRWPI